LKTGKLDMELREDELKEGLLEREFREEPELKTGEFVPGKDKDFEITEPFNTMTLGEIYLSQKKYEEALKVFMELREKDPDDKKISAKIHKVLKLIENEKKD